MGRCVVGEQKIGSGALRLVLLSALAAGCGSAEDVTSVHLTVQFSGMQIDQLAFSVRSPARAPLEAIRPSTIVPGTWLSSPQTVVVYLPDVMAEQTVTCEAKAMAMGAALAAKGQTDAVLHLHQVVEATIQLNGTGADPAATPPPMTPPPPMPQPKCKKDNCDKNCRSGNPGDGPCCCGG
ncbi:MAG TPA: hypothetical protein VFH73_25795 [Polyangia bacterium]|jgi:hypothetical protein|nr:hypothetical protein [Polyangia bacterium]